MKSFFQADKGFLIDHLPNPEKVIKPDMHSYVVKMKIGSAICSIISGGVFLILFLFPEWLSGLYDILEEGMFIILISVPLISYASYRFGVRSNVAKAILEVVDQVKGNESYKINHIRYKYARTEGDVHYVVRLLIDRGYLSEYEIVDDVLVMKGTDSSFYKENRTNMLDESMYKADFPIAQAPLAAPINNPLPIMPSQEKASVYYDSLCPRCGAVLDKGFGFCPKCGKKIKNKY
jgi:hypothetical protein